MTLEVKTSLDRPTIVELNRSLLSYFSSLSIFKRCRDAFYELLLLSVENSDNTNRYFVGELEKFDVADSVTSADMLAHAMWLGWQNTAPCNCLVDHVFSLSDIAEVSDFLRELARYAFVYDYLRMCLAMDAKAELHKNVITFNSAEKVNRQIQTLDFFSKPLGWDEFPLPETMAKDIGSICEGEIACVGDLITYQVKYDVLKRVVQYLRSIFAPLQQFENTPTTEIYDLSEFREVWTCLLAYSLMHIRMLRPFKKVFPQSYYASRLLHHSKTQWINQIHSVIGLESNKIEAVLNDITYKGDLYKDVDRAPLPPFVPTEKGLLLLDRVLITSMAEEDIYRLYELMKSESSTTMKMQKEPLQLERLRRIFRDTKVQVFGPFDNVTSSLGNTDLDALIYSPGQKTVWCCQLKSPMVTRWLKDYSGAASMLNEAFEQVDKSLLWLESAPPVILQTLELSILEYRHLSFRGVVVSSKSLGGGRSLRRPDVPLTNEHILNKLVRMNENHDLDRLWTNLKSAAILPILGIDYRLMTTTCKLAERTFEFNDAMGVPIWWDRLEQRYDLQNSQAPDA